MANTHSINLVGTSSQTLSKGDTPTLDFGTVDFTIEYWVKCASTSDTKNFLVNKWLNGGNRHGYTLGLTGDGYAQFALINGNDDTTIRAIGSTDLCDDTWYHIAGVRSGNNLYVYVNGIQVGNNTGVDNYNVNTSASFIIGARITGEGGYFTGKVDEVRAWRIARTTQEIADNYEIELTGSEDNLEGYWKLNNSLLDETANDNDLTNNNAATFSTDIPFGAPVAKARSQGYIF